MVTVWLATSVDFADGFELDLYDASNMKAPKQIDVNTDHHVVKARAKLYIHRRIARPKALTGRSQPLPRGRVLGYEIQALNRSFPESSIFYRQPLGQSLSSEKLTYGGYPWPTFFLQADRAPLRVLH